MKKWFVVLCFGFVGVAAFAQVDPHATFQNGKRVSVGIESMFSNKEDPRVRELRENGAAIERRVAQAQAQAKTQGSQAQQQPQTSWPHEDGITDAAAIPSSDRPSYYAEEEAYKNCNGIEICRTWAAEQAQKDPHFQVLSAIISMPDYHNQRLEVTYVTENAEGKQVFAEDFGKWEKAN